MNEEVRRGNDVRDEVSDRMGWNFSKRLGHGELSNVERVNKKVYESHVEGRRDGGKPYTDQSLKA